MDLDLLNYYVRKIGFRIKNSYLILQLQPSSFPLGYSYQIKLSDNKKKILHFFGYDATVDVDRLSEKNLFVYLSSNQKLSERHVSYDSFKGRSAKNNHHRKFNDYLVKNRKYISEYSDEELEKLKHYWKENAIKSFPVANEMSNYQYERNVVDKVMKMYYATEITLENHYKLHFFIRYWGVKTVKDWEQERFDSEWREFRDKNWSNLEHF